MMKKFLNKFFIIIIFFSAAYSPVSADMLKSSLKPVQTESAATKAVESKNLPEIVSIPGIKTKTLPEKYSKGSVISLKKLLYLAAGLIVLGLFITIYIAKFRARAKNQIHQDNLSNNDINQTENLSNISMAVSSFVKHRIRK